MWEENRLLDREDRVESAGFCLGGFEKIGEVESASTENNNALDVGKTLRKRMNGEKLLTAILMGSYFSILSAFHFGWHEANVGNWIARIQPHEYVLRPSGWVRMVSGVQSLVSVYLLALWVLTYFGRPFE